MLYIRNEGNGKAALANEEQLRFVKQCELYIAELKDVGKLVAAQPLLHEGCIISRKDETWVFKDIDPAKEIQVGYYHINAADMSEAISIAKNNPEFMFVSSASIELRPVKIKEERTGFIYPGQQ